MRRYYLAAAALFAATVLAVMLSALAPSGAMACAAKSPPVGPDVSIDGAPRFIWPLRGPLMTDLCAGGSERRFRGIDIAAPEGTPVAAAADGVVAYAGDELKDIGNIVLVLHDGGWVTAYAYASSLLVQRGDVVTQGGSIALSGRSLTAGTPLLHFEIRKHSSPVDPLRLLPERHDG